MTKKNKTNKPRNDKKREDKKLRQSALTQLWNRCPNQQIDTEKRLHPQNDEDRSNYRMKTDTESDEQVKTDSPKKFSNSSTDISRNRPAPTIDETQTYNAKRYLQTKLLTNIDSNDHHGDNIFAAQENERILFHNINGIKDEANWFQIITTMSELNVSIFGFAEINKSLNKGLGFDWRSILRKIFYYSRTTFSESTISFDTNYKPGGTMMTITGKWQARISEHGQDPKGLGRWSYQKISSKRKSITFVTAYRPCVSQGPSTSWMQQWILLRESGCQTPNPIQQFYDDLEEFLTKCKKSGSEIVLMIDANESIGDKPGGLTTILGRLELTDLVRCNHPNTTEPNTHARGSTRIDYIFGSKTIRKHCKRSGILPFGIGYLSDHRAIFAELDIDSILSSNVKPVDSIAARKLHKATPKERHIFLQEADTFMEMHGVYEKLKQLHDKTPNDWDSVDMEMFEKCDEMLIKGVLHAEKVTRRQKNTPWSPRFAKAVNNKSFWKIALSLKMNHRYPNENFIQWSKSMGIENFSAIDLSLVKKNLRAAQLELREVEKAASELREQHLRDLLTEAELMGTDESIQRRLKILIRAHERKTHFHRLKNILKPNSMGGLSYILVPKDFKDDQYPYNQDSVDEWEPIHDAEKMQNMLQMRNIIHFGQAQGTLFTIPPLDKLNWQATSIEAEELLAGLIPVQFVSDNQYTMRILEHISKRESIPPHRHVHLY
jgi:hypothetical protein